MSESEGSEPEYVPDEELRLSSGLTIDQVAMTQLQFQQLLDAGEIVFVAGLGYLTRAEVEMRGRWLDGNPEHE
jgi:hypothetical protein